MLNVIPAVAYAADAKIFRRALPAALEPLSSSLTTARPSHVDSATLWSCLRELGPDPSCKFACVYSLFSRGSHTRLSPGSRGYASAADATGSGSSPATDSAAEIGSDIMHAGASDVTSNAVLSTAMDLVAGLQSATGLPWWASITTTAFGTQRATPPA